MDRVYHIDRGHERIEEKFGSAQASFVFLRAETRSNPGQSRPAMAREALPRWKGVSRELHPDPWRLGLTLLPSSLSFRGPTVCVGPRNLVFEQPLADHKQVPRSARDDTGVSFSWLKLGDIPDIAGRALQTTDPNSA